MKSHIKKKQKIKKAKTGYVVCKVFPALMQIE